MAPHLPQAHRASVFPEGPGVEGLAQSSGLVEDWGESKGIGQMLHQKRSLWNSG